MFRKQATLLQFARFTAFAFGRGLRLAIWASFYLLSLVPANASDLIYVSLADNTIVTYDVSLSNATDIANSKQVFANIGTASSGMVFDQNGNFYSANYYANNVTRYDSTGNLIATITTAGMSGPVGLAIDSAGNLYSSSHTSGKVFKFDPTGNRQTSFTLSIAHALGLAFDGNDNLYVVSNSEHRIYQVDPTGSVTGSITSSLNYPGGISMSSNGQIFVTNDLGNSVSIFNYSPSLQYVGSFSTAFARPNRIAFDSQGYLYVTYTNTHKVSKYDTLGNLQLSWDLTTQASGLAFNHVNVPEPSTYALGLIAAGALAWVARRRMGHRHQA